MKTLRNKHITGAVAGAFVALGIVAGFWPLCLVGVVCAALVGRWVLALLLGLFVDSMYGVPTGFLHVVYFPFTLCALAGIVARGLVVGRIRTTHTDRL